MTISPSKNHMLNSWNPARQQQYRARHQAVTFHFLLDQSPSMLGQAAMSLRRAYNMYLAWLQQHADPMSLAEVRCFSTVLDAATPLPLGTLRPLTARTYDPGKGDGTALYRAIGDTCTTASADGQHILVVFTDGSDNTSGRFAWTLQKVVTLLQTLQEHQGWLCVFLGAFPDALPVGTAMGFRAGNCLVCTTDQIPEAFTRLQQGTARYLAAPPQGRKLLAAQGVF